MNGLIAVFAILSLLQKADGSAAPQPASALDAAARTRAIEGVLAQLNAAYVFPEVARKMEASVRERVATRAYESIVEGRELADWLTRDLQTVSHDLHLRVRYSAEPLPEETGAERHAPSPAAQEAMKRERARENFGFARIEVLPGNVGYLRMDGFLPAEWASETCASAMNYLAHTDALILDLRQNGGGDPQAVAMVCSYFFDEPTHLNDIYSRVENTTRQFWTWALVPGARYGKKPLFVLTSRRTFSAAEECAYNLKNLKRAPIVGETTGGGAHPGGWRRADAHFMVWVPDARSINPISKGNWEGTGVTPDVSVPAARALGTAHVQALGGLIDAAKDDLDRRRLLERARRDAEARLQQIRAVSFSLAGFGKAKEVFVAGDFNGWSGRTHPMTRQGDAWSLQIEMEPGKQAYKFLVDGRWITDPANPATEDDGNGNTNSVRMVP